MTFPASIARTLTLVAWCAVVHCDWHRCDWRISSAAGAQPLAADLELATRAVRLLETYCHDCHGQNRETPGLDVLDIAGLRQPIKDKLPFVTAGQPDQSRLYLAMSGKLDKRMPPAGAAQPSDLEREVIRDWIKAGAIAPRAKREPRPLHGEEEVIAMIASDLGGLEAEQALNTRYFSLLHLWNDSQLSDDDLRMVRAAVSKLINSLSDQPRVILPRIVDPGAGLLLAIDLRNYGWEEGADRNAWNRMLAVYPYGLHSNSPAAQEVAKATGVDLPYLRADWFVFHAARPPLYYDLLRLPLTQSAVEGDLGVQFEENFKRHELQRAGFRRSGVSQNNRVVQRQLIPPVASPQRTYWSSYDFADDRAAGDALTRPLGPIGGDRDPQHAFKHAGGEMIYHLPNFLHGYYLADALGNRIDEGPINIVSDRDQFSGSPAVVNGVSCFGCHRQGYRAVHDTLRETFADDRTKLGETVRQLYPPRAQLDKLLHQDQQHYQKALDQAILPLLHTGPDDKRTTTDFAEPITQVSVRYGRDLDLNKVGRELLLGENPVASVAAGPDAGGPSFAQFKRQLTENSVFRVLGLAPLATNEIVDRFAWESIYQKTALALNLGTPREVAGVKRFSNSLDMDFVLIPAAAKVELGAPADEPGFNLGEEVRIANIAEFYLGVLEITQDEYLSVMGDTPSHYSFFSQQGARSELVKKVMVGRLPVEKVSARDADKFCRLLSDMPAERAAGRRYRLPTEDEWEYACRAGTKSPYHTGSQLKPDQARFGKVAPSPAVCGTFAPNKFGLYDMHGNVDEWCSNSLNPGAKVPDRALRGGSWRSSAEQCRSAARKYWRETELADHIGFRVVCELKTPEAK